MKAVPCCVITGAQKLAGRSWAAKATLKFWLVKRKMWIHTHTRPADVRDLGDSSLACYLWKPVVASVFNV